MGGRGSGRVPPFSPPPTHLGQWLGDQNASWNQLVSLLVPFLKDTFDSLPVRDKDVARITSLHILVKKSS